MKKKQTPTQTNTNRKKARILLGTYWLSNVLRGNSIPETTLKVLKIEGNALKKEYAGKRGKTGGKTAGSESSAKKTAAGKLAGGIFRRILKKERVIR